MKRDPRTYLLAGLRQRLEDDRDGVKPLKQLAFVTFSNPRELPSLVPERCLVEIR